MLHVWKWNKVKTCSSGSGGFFEKYRAAGPDIIRIVLGNRTFPNRSGFHGPTYKPQKIDPPRTACSALSLYVRQASCLFTHARMHELVHSCIHLHRCKLTGSYVRVYLLCMDTYILVYACMCACIQKGSNIAFKATHIPSPERNEN